jgi:hypothetical protein
MARDNFKAISRLVLCANDKGNESRVICCVKVLATCEIRALYDMFVQHNPSTITMALLQLTKTLLQFIQLTWYKFTSHGLTLTQLDKPGSLQCIGTSFNCKKWVRRFVEEITCFLGKGDMLLEVYGFAGGHCGAWDWSKSTICKVAAAIRIRKKSMADEWRRRPHFLSHGPFSPTFLGTSLSTIQRRTTMTANILLHYVERFITAASLIIVPLNLSACTQLL